MDGPPTDYDPWMDGAVEVPRLTLFKILSRRSRELRLKALADEGGCPQIVLERERELIDGALDEMLSVNERQEWFNFDAMESQPPEGQL